MSRTVFWLLASALFAMGAGMIWFWSNFDRESYVYRTGMSGAALRNNFLAAHRLAERMDLPARELKNVISLSTLPPRAALMLPALRETLSDRDRDRILKWVIAGGYLVIEAERLGTPDSLLDALGVSRVNGNGVERSQRGEPAYAWPGRDQALRVTLYPQPRLDRAHTTLRLTRGAEAALINFPLGAGQVTVVSSLAFASNGAIGNADNAEFFWQLIELAGPREGLLIFNRAERLSLIRWLSEYALPALIGLFAILALWLWRIAPRFGPLAPDPAAARHSLLDHLRACGRFAWSSGQGPHLASVAHETALRQIARRHPDFAARDARARISWLVSALGLTSADAQLLVQPTAPATHSEFVRLIALFQWVYEKFGPSRLAGPPHARNDDDKRSGEQR